MKASTKDNMKSQLGVALIIFVSFLIWAGIRYKDVILNGGKRDEIVVEEDIGMIHNIKIRVNDKEYTVRMDTNKAAQEFAQSTPFELNMTELNGNEKYYQGSDTLIPSAHRVDHIKTGDLMLYNDNCIVLFYQDFDTEYSYTRLGWVFDSEDLAETLGDGDVIVTFTKN